MPTFEVEIKSLLGGEEKAGDLRTKILSKGGKLKGKNNQLNHYFNFSSENSSLLKQNLSKHIDESKRKIFEEMIESGKNISIRTREMDGRVIFVMKASLGDDTSSNGVKRVEFESDVSLSLDDLDRLLLDSGLTYQAKWSRQREEYEVNDINICVDKNAGYGYLAEFEKVTDDEGKLDDIKSEILDFMKELEVEELSQDRLERMFKYYNENWQNYYGTDNVFNIE